jgi:DNA polymerase-3 subunit alpha
MYFHVCGKDIRFGLLALKNVGISFAASLIEERKRGGAYTAFESFLSRISERELGKRQIEALIKSGALDSLGIYRSRLLATYEKQIDDTLSKKRGNVAGQLDIFALFSDDIASAAVEYPDIPEFSPRELLLLENESSGMYFSGHLLDGYKADIESRSYDEVSAIMESFAENAENPKYHERDSVTLCGIITAKTVKNTKGGSQMAFLTLEDRYGEIEVIVFPKQYEQYQLSVREETAVRIFGSLSSREDEGVKLIAAKIEPLLTDAEMAQKSPEAKKLYLRVERIDSPVAKEALEILKLSRGDSAVLFYEKATKKYIAPRGVSVSPTDMVLGALRALLGRENVIYQ